MKPHSLCLSASSTQELHTLLAAIDARLAEMDKVKALASTVRALCQQEGVSVGSLCEALDPLRFKKNPRTTGLTELALTERAEPLTKKQSTVLFKVSENLTWNGMGLMPVWLAEELRLGKNIEAFYVGPAEKRVEIVSRYKNYGTA